MVRACELGLEGIVSKRLSEPYVSGRTGIWTKAKCRATQHAIVGGWNSSELPKLTWSSLQARGIERVCDLHSMSLADLLRRPNINRRAATTLIDLYADLEQGGRT